MRPPPLSTPRPPYDYRVGRRGWRSAGPVAAGHVDEVTPGLVDGTIREGEGANTWDRLVDHERMPWYHRDYMVGQDNTLVDWTRCGPVRPSLRMLQQTVRKLVGTDNTRNFDPRPIRDWGSQDQGHGMHTNPTPAKRFTNARYRERVQMQPARQDRLSPSRQTGASYSQTTRVQG
jgi:hypothetical protein